MTTAVIADTQPLYRDGLKLLLRNRRNVKVVSEAENSEELSKAVTQYQPQLVMLDYDLPGHFSVDDIGMIRKNSPESRIIIVSSDPCKSNINRVLESGVESYITKECNKEQVLRAIETVARGEKFFCHKVLEVLLEKRVNPVAALAGIAPELTEREMEVTRYIGTGKKPFEIADEFSISIHTVRTHLKNIMKKLNLKSTSDLVLYAINNRIV
ncbi:response regulator transcription factor [Fulvivirga sp. 29W222]|uniref:Response regulator transcription factor n=1 Tax=Fulvivirga marina TaxID=2494733 RepID=A0A937KC59_9BACT|nr:response regulator transcription factor [Fulvivirga marina]MBL6447826.1 response regulator transcription factor [Fulvivirga marina]